MTEMETVTSNPAQRDSSPAVNIRCPRCRKEGVFHPFGVKDIGWDVHRQTGSGGKVSDGPLAVGSRRCPNTECNAFVFVVIHRGKVVRSYPPEVIDFDSSNLPPRILASLEEAIKAHAAGCYRASALMVRRVLEELCEDKQASGKNLMERLKALGNTVILPGELLAAADELRLLGNDAAHIEAKTYDQIGPDECAIAIELAKELLKAVYQYTNLVARLQALKKSP
ncbi:DUF4145 domain-containing protein [Rhizobium binxianense]|uniref:DUF4145 domain-containing protein n=1 Tax=Rhizobium binxianense TaxID=3024242 RepID=UPI0023A9CD01|nr:DUF4145 domain-containing protein [Rhizobium sp. MJ22]WEA24041.1 DUF4145 domain-containing protein [Rhizobium sp. MJ22]